MKSIFALLALAICVPAFAQSAVDTTVARDRLELGHQIKQAKDQMRRERRAVRDRYWASRFEKRAKALRTEEATLETTGTTTK